MMTTDIQYLAERRAKEIFKDRLRKGDRLSQVGAVVVVILAVFPALSLTGFFFPFIAQIPFMVILALSSLGTVVGFCLHYPDRRFWRVGIVPGIITGPLIIMATIWYTSPRQTIWSFELLIPMLIGGLPGGLIWYYILKATALPQLKDEIQQAMLNENNN